MHPRLKDKAWDDPPAKRRMFLADIHALYNLYPANLNVKTSKSGLRRNQ